MRLPIFKSSKFKVQSSKLFLGILTLFILIFPNNVRANFTGGINIGDHYSEFDQAAQASNGTGWVYVMMPPSEAYRINQWLAKYPNINLVIRGHVPDYGGNTLTSEYANSWAEALSSVSKPIYFMPINEPNNPYESGSGIPAPIVVDYINHLKNALAAKNIINSKVILLSPTIDVYTLYDGETDGVLASYIRDLGGWPFFREFSGIALNLYGHFKGGILDPDAPLIKKGQGYREFLQTHFGASSAQAVATKIFAVETGVIKVEDAKVKYKENSAEIVSYLNTVKPIWGNDPNFSMFAIFSYDPAGDRSPWIYNDSSVLSAMNLKNVNIPTPTSQPVQEFSAEVDTFTQANRKLLPKMIQEQINKECVGGIMIFDKCILGEASNPQKLAHQTENFQPVFVPQEKVVDRSSCNNFFGCLVNSITDLFKNAINPQLEEPLTGSLNAYRPGNLQFSHIADSGNKYVAQNSQDTKVLGTADSPELKTKQSYAFTMKMLLPSVFGDKIAVPTLSPALPSGTPIPSSPTPTEGPGQPTIAPTITPPVYLCAEGSSYCTVSNLRKFFPTDETARQASIICQKESGSDPFAANRGCLTGRSVDYSIGLFQINLLAHCPEAFAYTWDPPSCTIKDQDKAVECELRFQDPENNIREALRISGNGSNWNPWAAARVCGIVQ